MCLIWVVWSDSCMFCSRDMLLCGYICCRMIGWYWCWWWCVYSVCMLIVFDSRVWWWRCYMNIWCLVIVCFCFIFFCRWCSVYWSFFLDIWCRWCWWIVGVCLKLFEWCFCCKFVEIKRRFCWLLDSGWKLEG